MSNNEAEGIDDVQYRKNLEAFNVAHPNQRILVAETKTPAELLIEIEESDARLIRILAALPSRIAYEFLQTVAGNRDDYTLSGIASRCGISKSTLSRLLCRARSAGGGATPPPAIGSSLTQYGRQSTRRGRAHRATTAKTQKKETKNEKASPNTNSHR